MPRGYYKDGTKKIPPSRKGAKLSSMHIELLRKVHTGKIVSMETRRKLSNALQGRVFTEDTKQKMSISHKGRDEDKSNSWKGSSVGYSGLHKWVIKNLGSPLECENCGLEGCKNGSKWNIHWANKSREYKRILNDWLALCAKCHKQYDS